MRPQRPVLGQQGKSCWKQCFYLGCLGLAFECLEMLFSRCFLAHAGSVYKQLLKAKPAGAAGGQALHGSPAPWHGVWGHRSPLSPPI